MPRARFQPGKGRHRNHHRVRLLRARVAALRWAKRRRRHGWRSERRGVQVRWIAAPPDGQNTCWDFDSMADAAVICTWMCICRNHVLLFLNGRQGAI